MTFEGAPETIRASLTAVRDGWYQLVNLRGGQRAFPLTEYTRSDIAKAEVSRLEQVVSSLEVYIMQMEDKIDSLEKSDD